MSRAWAWVQALGEHVFDTRHSLRAAALLRLLMGPIVLIHLAPFVAEMRLGRYYADAFYLPWTALVPELPRGAYFGLLSLCTVAAVSMSVGLFTRASVIYVWAFVTYNLLLSQTHFHHNRAFLVINLMCLMLVASGRELSVDAWLARRRGAPLDPEGYVWPLYLLRFEAVSVYGASGISKLLGEDWWSGLVTFDRVLRFRHKLEASIAPEWFVELLTQREFHAVFAKIAVTTEVGIALGLLFASTRRAAIWVAILFHVAIGIGLEVQVFSYLGICALLAWVTPSARDRVAIVDSRRRGGRFIVTCLRRLDWLARFELREGDTGGAAVVLIERDGTTQRGATAALTLLARCPLLFVGVAPWQLPGLRSIWARLLRGAF